MIRDLLHRDYPAHVFPPPEDGWTRLGIRLCDDLGDRRVACKARSIEVNLGGTQKWGSDDWPPERIMQLYGPVTWNPSETISGARELIYNLNRIIIASGSKNLH